MNHPLAGERPRRELLGRWVLADAVGELVGLGGVALLARALVPAVQRELPGDAAVHLGTAVLLVALGSLDGWVGGCAPRCWGPILAAVQVRVLRRHVARPSLWLPANALGWSVGMPRVFLAIGLLARHGPRPSVVASSAAALLVAGALVGLVEGAFLLRMGWRGARSPAPVNV